jgi:hypothetical protein
MALGKSYVYGGLRDAPQGSPLDEPESCPQNPNGFVDGDCELATCPVCGDPVMARLEDYERRRDQGAEGGSAGRLRHPRVGPDDKGAG